MAIDHHIEELAAIGVPRPSSVPLYYRVAAALLTQAPQIEVLGAGQLRRGRAGAGACARPLVAHGGLRPHRPRRRARSASHCRSSSAPSRWRRQPGLGTTSSRGPTRLACAPRSSNRVTGCVYQDGTLASIRPLEQLIAGLPADAPVADGLVLFCGTLGALPDAGWPRRAARRHACGCSSIDGDRTLAHEYASTALPQVA